MTTLDQLSNKETTCYFETNLRLLMQVHSPFISHEMLEDAKWIKYHCVELYFIKKYKTFFNLNNDGEFVKASELYAAVILSERVLLLFCEHRIKIYPFESSFDLRKFLITTEIEWLIGDQLIFMNPANIAHIEHEPCTHLLVVFKSLLPLKFNKVQVPGKFFDTTLLFIELEARKKRLPLTVCL